MKSYPQAQGRIQWLIFCGGLDPMRAGWTPNLNHLCNGSNTKCVSRRPRAFFLSGGLPNQLELLIAPLPGVEKYSDTVEWCSLDLLQWWWLSSVDLVLKE